MDDLYDPQLRCGHIGCNYVPFSSRPATRRQSLQRHQLLQHIHSVHTRLCWGMCGLCRELFACGVWKREETTTPHESVLLISSKLVTKKETKNLTGTRVSCVVKKRLKAKAQVPQSLKALSRSEDQNLPLSEPEGGRVFRRRKNPLSLLADCCVGRQ